MADIFTNKAPKEIAVIPFYATAAIFFLVLSVLLCIAAPDLTGHYFHPHILAIVHAAALGWATMIILGAAYQLLPVICERELFSTRMAFLSYLLLTIGTCLLVWCFWHFDTGKWLIAGGTCIALASYLYAFNIYRTASDSSTSQIHQHFLLISAFWLCFTTTVGLLLAINLNYTFIPRNHLDMLKLHAHAGIAGWFLQLICGVGAKLIPMFLLGKSKKDWLLYASLILQNLGLILFLVDGYSNPVNLKMSIYALFVALGTFCWLLYIADAYKHRLRKKVDVFMRYTAFSALFQILAFGLIPIILINKSTQWTALYGTLIFLGWITGIILGKTFKTLPFIVWNNRYKNLHGKAKIPMPKQLYSENIVRYQYYGYLGTLILMCAGIIWNQGPIIQVATASWIIVALFYGYNVFRIIFHKTTIEHGHIPL